MRNMLLLTLAAVIIFIVLNQWFFWGGWFFLFFSLLPGFLITLTMKGDKSTQFIMPLIIGSLFYSFAGMVAVESLHYFSTAVSFNWSNVLQFSFVYAFVSFLGGLIGVVTKGFTTVKLRHS